MGKGKRHLLKHATRYAKLKKVLIISPYFPPVNAADMQRVRMSLPFFAENGWHAEVVTVDEKYADISKDDLLMLSVPAGIKVHKVKAFDKSITSKFGLGSIALRSLWFIRQMVNHILSKEHFDLIYFSTTQFPLCILGPYWKKKFNIPYVIDMQDPWHSDYYQNKPQNQRPAKYWFSYRLNKYLEPIAMKSVDGLISVSEDYLTDLKQRYQVIKTIPAATIPFGFFEPDFKIAFDHQDNFKKLLDNKFINIVYIGRGGADMHSAVSPVFEALKAGLENEPEVYSKLRLYLVGTSYAANGNGKATILPLAKQYNIENHVVEITDRISYYHTLATLQQADALFIPGSDDPKYSASKIYPYLYLNKPLLAIFNAASPAIAILKHCGLETVYNYQTVTNNDILGFFNATLKGSNKVQQYNKQVIEQYGASRMAFKQCQLFNEVLDSKI